MSSFVQFLQEKRADDRTERRAQGDTLVVLPVKPTALRAAFEILHEQVEQAAVFDALLQAVQ